jgi:hypothetical protein
MAVCHANRRRRGARDARRRWESFVRGDTGYIAQREGPNKEILTYVLAYVKA